LRGTVWPAYPGLVSCSSTTIGSVTVVSVIPTPP
jgi:hypothetical protein